MASTLTPKQEKLLRIWEEHTKCEFETHDVEATMGTMIGEPHVNHVPVMTGGTDWKSVREFYATRFICQMPPDTQTELVSRTIGTDQIVDELIFRFTHTVKMDWMLPGVPPTGKRVEVPLVAIVGFREEKVSHEHIYWDQASVLVQIGILNPDKLPVAGAETAHKVLNPKLPSNELMDR